MSHALRGDAGKRIALFTNNEMAGARSRQRSGAGLQIAAVIDARRMGRPPTVRWPPRGVHVLHGSVSGVEGGKDGVKNCGIDDRRCTRPKSKPTGLPFPEAEIRRSGHLLPSRPAEMAGRHRCLRSRWRLQESSPLALPTAPSALAPACPKVLTPVLWPARRRAQRQRRIAGRQRRGLLLTPLWHVAGKGKAFVDYQHDVTASDVELAQREGFGSVEHLKRYTTLGMATDQGKTSNIAGLAIMAAVSGRSIPETGTTIYRPPYVPVAIGAFAGHHRDETFHATRLTPSHRWAAEQGAIFVDTGLWKRAQWYPRGRREGLAGIGDPRGRGGQWRRRLLRCLDARQDRRASGATPAPSSTASTSTPFSSLAVGKARYGLMLREDGLVYDDGTTSRLADDHYFLTTTTAKAGLVMQHLEFCRQVLFPELDVQLTSVSDQWAQFSIAGPKHARSAASKSSIRPKTCPTKAFPFMGAREVALRGGIKARLFRISFSGEMAFEISVPARYGDALVRNLMIAGKPFGVTPYGTEALGVMRIEKGHVAGPELNGTTTAADLGLGKMMSTKKDFVGRVMAGREALVAPDRQVVVGIKPVDRARRLRSGAHIIPKGADARPGHRPGLCHLGLLLAGARPVDRARAGRARPRTHRRDRRARTIRCAARTTRSSSAIPSSTIRMEGASVAEFSWDVPQSAGARACCRGPTARTAMPAFR